MQRRTPRVTDCGDTWLCPGCGEWKPSGDYYRKATWNGIGFPCRACVGERSRVAVRKPRPDQRGPLNPNWRGGRVVEPRGYVLIRVGVGHPLADCRGYAYEHRLNAAAAVGEDAIAGKMVHHVNETPGDNSCGNLEAVTHAEHRFKHRTSGRALRMPGEANPEISCKCGCGAKFDTYDASGRPRRFVSGHNRPNRPSVDAVKECVSRGLATIADVAAAAGLSEASASQSLSNLAKAGDIIRTGHGRYALPAAAPRG